MSMDKLVASTGGCIRCIHCEKVRFHYFCGRTKLSENQLYNKLGYCSKFEDRTKSKEE